MKVVALISGGKDSLFSILHCIVNKHDVVALANLYPSKMSTIKEDQDQGDQNEDIDSHMYQTVGHCVIPLYEAALNIPLYRLPIAGDAIQKGQTYDFDQNQVDAGDLSSEPDETESLTRLLLKVKASHPDVDAVSTGAILSTYQRTRVESVALRLGLVPLSFLWQFPYLPSPGHSTLLNDMARVGADARIVKVASGGLDVSHLWLNVADAGTISKLERDMSRYGELEVGAVLGEGGDYETIAVDGPSSLWKKRIVVDLDDTSFVTSDGGVSHVRIDKATLEDKEPPSSNVDSVRTPDLLDLDFQVILERFQTSNTLHQITTAEANPEFNKLPNFFMIDMHETADVAYFNNITPFGGGSLQHQTEHVCQKLKSAMARHSLTPDDLSSVTILLRSIDDFATVNSGYTRLFVHANPPARITVACGDILPPSVSIVLSGTARKCDRAEGHGLHVQSQSYWAPANIGPYSQAISTPVSIHSPAKPQQSRIVSIAGQIPLVPATMEMVDGPFELHTVLALQHLWRIGRATHVDWWINGLAFVTASTKDEAHRRAEMALRVWQLAVDEPVTAEDDDSDDDFDIGDLNLRQPWQQPAARTAKLRLQGIPNWSRCSRTHFDSFSPPPCFIAQVHELPRRASIEWTSIGLALENDENKAASTGMHPRYHTVDCASGTRWTMLAASDTSEIREVFQYVDTELEKNSIELLEAYMKWPTDHFTIVQSEHRGAQIIPCLELWSEKTTLRLLLRIHWFTHRETKHPDS